MNTSSFNKYFQDISFVISHIFAAGIIFFTLNKHSSFVSLLISLSFILVYFVFANKVRKKEISKILFGVFYLSMLIVLFSVTISGGSGFNYYKKAIMYLATLAWIIVCVHSSVSKTTCKSILFINLFVNLLYPLFYKQGFSAFEGQILLTLNFLNPNQAGMFILNSLFYLGIYILSGNFLFNRKICYKLSLFLFIPLFFFNLQLLIMTGCRSSYMGLGVFIILILIDYITRGRFVIKKWMSILIAVIPFIFVFVYLSSVDTFNADVSMGIDNPGKDSQTRVPVWKPIVDNFFHYIGWGDYYGISDGTGMSQLHNTHLDVYASYGMLPLILYMFLLYKTINFCMNNCVSRFQRFSLYAFVANMVLCVFEASLVSGSGGLFLLTLGFLTLSNCYTYESPSSKCCIR